MPEEEGPRPSDIVLAIVVAMADIANETEWRECVFSAHNSHLQTQIYGVSEEYRILDCFVFSPEPHPFSAVLEKALQETLHRYDSQNPKLFRVTVSDKGIYEANLRLTRTEWREVQALAEVLASTIVS